MQRVPGPRLRGVRRDGEGVVMWQPIETAPRDGKEVLGYDRGVVSGMYWNGSQWEWTVLAWSDETYGTDATHWMPLPEPPK